MTNFGLDLKDFGRYADRDAEWLYLRGRDLTAFGVAIFIDLVIGLADAGDCMRQIGLTGAEFPPRKARETGSGEFARVYRSGQPGLHKQVIGAEPLF